MKKTNNTTQKDQHTCHEDVHQTHSPNSNDMAKHLQKFVQSAGFSTDQFHLNTTHERVTDLWLNNLLDGYKMDPTIILGESYPSTKKSMVIVQNIQAFGLCPHHLLPFHGVAHLAYLPNQNIVGFSRLADIVRCYTHRLTLQENATEHIADALMQYLQPLGAGCIIQAQNTCMTLRHSDQRATNITTSCFLGTFETNPPWQQMLPLH